MSTAFRRFGFALAFALVGQGALGHSAAADTTTRSSSIALSEASTRLFNVNVESDSVSVFAVSGNGDTPNSIPRVSASPFHGDEVRLWFSSQIPIHG